MIMHSLGERMIRLHLCLLQLISLLDVLLMVIRYTLGFMGYGPEESNAVFELTYNYGTTEYAKGNAYVHTVGVLRCRLALYLHL